MSELKFMKSIKNMAAEDNPNFDAYATQFVSSLVAPDDPYNYWHGRLIGFGADENGNWQGYKINFFGKNYNEKEFRDKLMNGQIKISNFKVSSVPVYMPDNTGSTNIDPQIVSYDAEIEVTIDGEIKTGKVSLTHQIRRTYLSYQTEIKQIS